MVPGLSCSRSRRALIATVMLLLGAAWLRTAPLAAQAGDDPPVIDPGGVLTPQEREFMGAAVANVRETTDYHATVLVADDLAGRSATEIVEQVTDLSAPDGQTAVILVLAEAPEPSAEVVADDDAGSASDQVRSDVDHARAAAIAAIESDGLGQAGVAFTEALIEGTPTQESKKIWWFAYVGLAVFLFSAVRTFLHWRRFHDVPRSPVPIGEAREGTVLLHGRVWAERSLVLSDTTDIVFFESIEKWTEKRIETIRDAGSGNILNQQETDHTPKSKRRNGGVPFAVQDDTGAIWIDHETATIDGRPLEQSYGIGDETFDLTGLLVGDEITVAGPVVHDQQGHLEFDRTKLGRVLVSARNPKRAYRYFRRQVRKRYLWTTFWLIVCLLLFSIRVPGGGI